MACRLVAPCQYMHRSWNIVNWTLGNKFQWNFNPNQYILIQEYACENAWKMASILSRPQWSLGKLCWIRALHSSFGRWWHPFIGRNRTNGILESDWLGQIPNPDLGQIKWVTLARQDDVMIWKRCPHWPSGRGIHREIVDLPPKRLIMRTVYHVVVVSWTSC